MVDPESGLAICWNGCIYNYPQLRDELIGHGYRFFSHSDTEVLLKAYHRWGDRFVDRLLGMFAFAIVERDSGRVLLGRDRLGIKPLYLTEDADRVRFASSLPALLAGGGVDTRIDPIALHHYLSFHSVVPPPHTILRGVTKVPPATLIAFEPDGRRTETVYWAPDFTRDPERADWSEKEWEDAVLDALRLAVRAPPGGRRPGGLPAVRRGGLQPDRRTAGRGRPDRPADVLDRVRIGRRRRRRRIRLLRHHRQALRHRSPSDPYRHRPDAARARRCDRCHERTDGQPRLCGLLPAQPGSGQARQGGAVRAGRRRGVRRLPLVSPAGRAGGRHPRRRGGVLPVGVLRPRHRRRRRVAFPRLPRTR